MRKLVWIILLFVIAVGCAGAAQESASYAPQFEAIEESAADYADDAIEFDREAVANGEIDLDIRSQNSQVQQRLIIKTGNMSLHQSLANYLLRH